MYDTQQLERVDRANLVESSARLGRNYRPTPGNSARAHDEVARLEGFRQALEVIGRDGLLAGRAALEDREMKALSSGALGLRVPGEGEWRV